MLETRFVSVPISGSHESAVTATSRPASRRSNFKNSYLPETLKPPFPSFESWCLTKILTPPWAC